MMRSLIRLALFLALFVVLLGAYTRLTDAGLGCPDWPGCYGQLLVPSAAQGKALATEHYPHRPFDSVKAWNEMVHRYLAGSLALLIGGLWLASLVQAKQRLIASLTLALVLFQALLGMWTVTLGLMPLVVMGHLLGGFSLSVLLYIWYRRVSPASELRLSPVWRWPITFGIALLVVQIALGGWTSANYAALSCQGFPLCHAPWSSLYSASAFHPLPSSDGANYEFGVLSYAQRVSIHVTHRLGAIVVSLYWFVLGLCLLRVLSVKPLAFLAATLGAQILLGVLNVHWQLPLSVAVAHNLGALLLLIAATRVLLLSVNVGLNHKERQDDANKDNLGAAAESGLARAL